MTLQYSTYIYTYIPHKTPVIWHLGKNLSCTWTKMKTMENVISMKYFLPHQLQQHIKLEGNALPFYPEFFQRWINICSPLYNVRKIDIVELYYSPLDLKKRPVFQKCKNEIYRLIELDYGEMLNSDMNNLICIKSSWMILRFWYQQLFSFMYFPKIYDRFTRLH